MAKYECKVCSYIYNEQQAGRPFEELTECPICNEDKSNFKMLEEEEVFFEWADGDDDNIIDVEVRPIDEEDEPATDDTVDAETIAEADAVEVEEPVVVPAYEEVNAAEEIVTEESVTEMPFEATPVAEETVKEEPVAEESIAEEPVAAEVAPETAEETPAEEQVNPAAALMKDLETAKDINTEYVVERRQEFWSPFGGTKTEKTDKEEAPVKKAWSIENAYASVERVLDLNGNEVKAENKEPAEEITDNAVKAVGAPEEVVEEKEETLEILTTTEGYLDDDIEEDEVIAEETVEEIVEAVAEEPVEETVEETVEAVAERTEFKPLWQVGTEPLPRVEEPLEAKAENVFKVEEPVAEAVEETVEEVAEEVAEETAEEVAEEAAEETAEEATEEAVEEAAEEATEETAEEVAEEAVEETVAEVAEEVVEEAAEEATEETAEEVAEEAVEETVAEVAEEAVEETVAEVAEEATEEVVEEAAEEAVEETVAEVAEEATEEVVEEATEEVVEEAAEEITEEVAEEAVDEEEEAAEESTSVFVAPPEAVEKLKLNEEFFEDIVTELPDDELIITPDGTEPLPIIEEVVEEVVEEPVEEVVEDKFSFGDLDDVEESNSGEVEEIFIETVEDPDKKWTFNNSMSNTLKGQESNAKRYEFIAKELGENVVAEEKEEAAEEIVEEVAEEVVAVAPVVEEAAVAEVTENVAVVPVAGKKQAAGNGLDEIMILPAQLSPMPLDERAVIETDTVIGFAAERPLVLDKPVIKSNVNKVVEYAPNKGLTSEDFQAADVIEIIVGRGEGIEKTISSKEDLRQAVAFLRLESDGCPIGIKLAAGRIERDLEFCVFAKPDFVVLNKFNVVPLPYALYRANKYLNTVQSNLDLVIELKDIADAEEAAKIIAMGADVIVLKDSDKDMDALNEQLKQIAKETGNYEVSDLNVQDLCTTNRDIAQYTDICHV